MKTFYKKIIKTLLTGSLIAFSLSYYALADGEWKLCIFLANPAGQNLDQYGCYIPTPDITRAFNSQDECEVAKAALEAQNNPNYYGVVCKPPTANWDEILPNPENQNQEGSATGTGYFQNPLTSSSVKSILGAIINILTFGATILIIMGIIRGVLYLATSQERPDNLSKGKTWILWSLAAAALVFGAQTFADVIIRTVEGVFGN